MFYVCAALHTSRLDYSGGRERVGVSQEKPRWFTDQPPGQAALSRRSRHLPPSVIVHAGRIQRVVRRPPIWLIELTHAGACGHFERRIRPIPMSGRTDRNE